MTESMRYICLSADCLCNDPNKLFVVSKKSYDSSFRSISTIALTLSFLIPPNTNWYLIELVQVKHNFFLIMKILENLFTIQLIGFRIIRL